MLLIYLGFLTSVVFMISAEYLFPAREQKNLFAHNCKNILLGYLWYLSFSLLPILQNFHYIVIWPRPLMDLKVLMVGGILILDFGTYWWHRFNHANSFFRKAHWVHHSDSYVNFSTTFRFHYIELAVYYLYKLAICSVLQIPLIVLLTYDSLTFSNGLFHHSNIKLNPTLNKYLSFLFVTPEFHFNHHSSDPKYANSNYGSFLVIWDKIFKTYSKPQEHEKIGLSSPYGKSYFQLMIRPFRKSKF